MAFQRPSKLIVGQFLYGADLLSSVCPDVRQNFARG